MVVGGGVQSHFRVQPNCCVEVVLSLGVVTIAGVNKLRMGKMQ